MKTVSDAAGAHGMTYSDAQDTETITGGILGGVALSVAKDGFGRRSGFTVASGTWSQTAGFGYHPATGRPKSVTFAGNTATYDWHLNSDLMSNTTFRHGTALVLSRTQGWDAHNRLKTVTHAWSGGAQSRETTLFDGRDRRKSITWEDGSSWNYDYNARGEVVAGNRTLRGQWYQYGFDNIGNRSMAALNGRVAAYWPNALNQITRREVPGVVEVMGTASADAYVMLNGEPALRQGEYFYYPVPVDNTAGAVDVPLTTDAWLTGQGSSREQHAFVPRTPEVFTYDLDGNLTSDGRWVYTWDAENRLSGMEAPAAVPARHRRKLAFAYDAQGRRIR